MQEAVPQARVPGTRLERVVLREIRLPLREPFMISSGVVAERRILLAQLTDADDVTTWSECVAGELPNYSAETVDTAWLALSQWFVPRLLGVSVTHPREAAPLLLRDVRGHRMAAATLEMGLWDLHARRADIPLAQLLGGTRRRIQVGISLGIQDSPSALADRARAAIADGYRRIKLKIRPGADVAYVAEVRSALGTDAPLMVDANNAYSIDDVDVLRQLDAFGLMMIEQPLDHEDLVRHAELQRVLRTPICLDESITSHERARDMIALGSGRVINIKPGRVGGLSGALAIHDLCATHGVPVWCGGMLESGIGRGYNVAVSSLPNFSLPGDVSPSSRYWEHDIVTPEWSMSGTGEMTVPSGSGTGVTADSDRIDNLTVRAETFAAR